MVKIEGVQDIEKLKDVFDALKAEIGKIIVGQDEVIEQLLIAILCDANALLESFPGMGKTMMVRTIANVLELEFSRIQSTPDLMPSDITGTYVIEEDRGHKVFKFQKGPVFANIVLADEINRATPKTQAALLEAMQEKQVTVGNQTFPLDRPFFVLATQNPIDQEGSLSLDQPVLVNGKLVTGEELLANAGECLLEDERGIRLYSIDAWTLSLTPKGRLERQRCLLYTLPYNQEFVTVRTKKGRMITVTKNHPFLVNEHGRMVWKRADELTKQDYLAAPRTLPEISARPISNRQVLEQVQDHRIPFDEDFAFWIGFLLSDGSISDKGVQAVQKNHPSALDRFIAISEGYGFHVSISVRRGCRHATVYSKALVQHLKAEYGLQTGKNKRIPAHFLSWPKPLLREFLKAYVGLESSLRDERIVFTQKHESDVNTVRYMLLRFGIASHCRHDGRIWRLKLQGEDAVAYLNQIGWIVPQAKIAPDKRCRSSFRVLPVDRRAILRLLELFGLNRFHTLKGRNSIAVRPWYNSVKGLRHGESVMAEAMYRSFVSDMRTELRARQTPDFKALLSSQPRRFAAGIGASMTGIARALNVSHNQVWKLYADGTAACEVQVREHLEQRYESVMQEAEAIVGALEQVAEADVCFEGVASLSYGAGKSLAFGLTVPKHHNYVAGFGACGINHNTYPLPEAQTDRFLLKILVHYPSFNDELEIVNRYTRGILPTFPKPMLNKVSLQNLQLLTREVPIAEDIKRKAVEIVGKTRQNKELIEYGASPRASIGIILAAKAHALLQGRKHVSAVDLEAMAFPVLRHRIILNFRAEREGKTTEDIIRLMIK